MAEGNVIDPVSDEENIKKPKLIWCGKRNKFQKKVDDEASRFFKTLVKAKWNKLSDGTTKKNVIWEDVGEEMNKNGYQTSEGNKSGVICSQKWNNMLNTYKNFTLLVEKTGSGADVLDMKPLLYDEIQEILGSAQNVHPQYVGDSSMDTQNPTRMDINSNSQKLKELENKKLPLHESDDEALSNTHFSDDQCDENDYDKKHVEPRSKKRKRNRKGSNAEKMIDLFAVMEKKREPERHEMRLEKQKRHEEKIDQTENLIEILRMAITQTQVKSHK
ncbi:hypothetical protein OUZ56_009982 [Daphnia magna]|uniref:Myb/SANT-like DNA-binding domain-containing protein n=1 Tax=Daphnia magna TaxID=35525 RepID=A0ABR0AHG2_9CRUS|nr:hypothetical protein OUZ56_009982 [Daphnia magna]